MSTNFQRKKLLSEAKRRLTAPVAADAPEHALAAGPPMLAITTRALDQYADYLRRHPRATDTEAYLQNKKLDDATMAEAAKLALKEPYELAHNSFKIPLTHAMVRRALAQVIA